MWFVSLVLTSVTWVISVPPKRFFDFHCCGGYSGLQLPYKKRFYTSLLLSVLLAVMALVRPLFIQLTINDGKGAMQQLISSTDPVGLSLRSPSSRSCCCCSKQPYVFISRSAQLRWGRAWWKTFVCFNPTIKYCISIFRSLIHPDRYINHPYH